ncbi:MAG: NAD-dependent epimerase/dehydratase family protein [Gammaproteobacteria bacterium]|nr:NAD-dependent epimerase/dehydratase family protein [Gammaproteobacteria bacterium]MDD9850445.1 NAD-dependent epimerase/dehydratase family protein [Gammaproteobacteria bacterium]
MRILVTGAAGFIGAHLVQRLITDGGHEIIGVDTINDYYDPQLKKARLKHLCIMRPWEKNSSRFYFYPVDIGDRDALQKIFAKRFDVAFNLAAQPGVRYSLQNPDAYINANVRGFHALLEMCRGGDVGHLVFASSSSVYGANRRLPFSTAGNVDHPLSLYAATKKCNELQAHVYAHLYGLPCTGLRFFTVYGPWGRPDMAYYSFTRDILAGRPIQVFNHGDMERDFTFVDDIVECMMRIAESKPPAAGRGWNGEPDRSAAPWRIYNIGGSAPVKLTRFIEILEQLLGKKAQLDMRAMQPGDLARTWADTESLERDFNYAPSTTLEEGLKEFVEWYREWHQE